MAAKRAGYAMSSLKIRRYVVTASVATIAALGAIYGAQLKGSIDARQVRHAVAGGFSPDSRSAVRDDEANHEV
jgi:hypothetical protein